VNAALLALALLAVAPAVPCQDREAQAAHLRELAAAGSSELSAELERTGAFAHLPSEAARPAGERAQLAIRRLESACALLERQGIGKAPPPDRARLTAILDRPEFAHARQRNTNLLEQWFARAQEWLLSLLESSQAQSFSEASRLVVLALALAVVLGGALRLWALRRRPGAGAAPGEAGRARLELEDPATHLALAQAALATDAREAIRQGLLCVLSALERRRLARPDRVKTNRELAAELPERGASPELCREVEPLLAWYDRTFYSLEPVPAAEAQAFVAGVSRLRATLAQGAA
jgi:hypothetical protein